MSNSSLNLKIIPNIPDIDKGDNISSILISALEKSSIILMEYDVLCIAHKIFSKAEGCIIKLTEITPSKEAIELGKTLNKDARKVEVVLQESKKIIRSFKRADQNEGTLICQHKLGFICANAGVDESNLAEHETVVTVPKNPEFSLNVLRDTLRNYFNLENLGIVMSDTFGRPWRIGQVNAAIGIAGLPATKKEQGTRDAWGNQLYVTEPAFCDEIAASSGLLMSKAGKCPAILLRGLSWSGEYGSASHILREQKEDMFR
ncbi:MAG: coenzyme F420-0:L-glutamate ligase [Paracoccaceae bacterium]